jgi:hypothetical protein
MSPARTAAFLIGRNYRSFRFSSMVGTEIQLAIRSFACVKSVQLRPLNEALVFPKALTFPKAWSFKVTA